MKARFLGIIPARGGSKGIPRKNMVRLGDRPLLQYTLQAARESRGLERVILTSDDVEMIELARSMRIDSPFKRPDYLATDKASSVDVVVHSLDWLKEYQKYEPDAVVLLQPTCPFRTGEDIDNAIKAFESSECECLMSVNPVMQHPCEMVTRSADGKLVWAAEHPAPGQGGRQVFPTFYFINGAIYIVTTEFLRKNRRFDDPFAAIHIMDSSHGLDIDDPYQLQLARGYLLAS